MKAQLLGVKLEMTATEALALLGILASCAGGDQVTNAMYNALNGLGLVASEEYHVRNGEGGAPPYLVTPNDKQEVHR